MAPRFIAKQLSRPSGFMGAVTRHLMNRHNARINAFAVQQLQLGPSDRVLEIGFGGGPRGTKGAAGCGHLRCRRRSFKWDVVDWAQRHFASSVKAGRAKFCQCNVESLPFEGSGVLKRSARSTRSISGSSLQAGFAEIRRVLKPQRPRCCRFSIRKRTHGPHGNA